ncbi:unnamed protein product [Closterium sp. Yama58-4]|nr:unnamed protein product [Closterium sp. Yama58-4]
MTRTHASSPGVLMRRLQAALTRRILPLAVALTVAYLTFFELVRPSLLSADIAQSPGSPLFPQSGCETARNCRGTLLDRYVYSADAEFRWKDTGNRMRAKESGGWWTGYVLLVNTHRWLNRTVTNRFSCGTTSLSLRHAEPLQGPRAFLHCLARLNTCPVLVLLHPSLLSPSQAPDNMTHANKGLVLFFIGAGWSDDGKDAPDNMPNANKGLVLFFIGAGWSDNGKDDRGYHVPKADAVFIRVAAPPTLSFPPSPTLFLPPQRVVAFISYGYDLINFQPNMQHLLDSLGARVVAFISYGYDLINFEPNMQHLLDSLGAVPILGRFYADFNLTQMLHSPQMRHIMSYTDPYFFRERLTMPKLLIAASNDEFFSMDDSLPAVDWPRLTWRFDWPTFTIHATSDRKPLAVRAWTGRTSQGSRRRDFRFIVKQGLTGCTVPFTSLPKTYIAKFGTICVQPIPFSQYDVSPPVLQPDGLWHFSSSIKDIPKVGYRAMFIEVEFKHGPYPKPLVLTTEAMIAPNTFPFAPCNTTACLTHFA